MGHLSTGKKRNQKVKKRNVARPLGSDTRRTRRQKDEETINSRIIAGKCNKYVDLCGVLGVHFAKWQQPKQQFTNIRLEYLTCSTKESCQQNSMLDWMTQLVETNMRSYYEACPGWGWDSKAKRAELEDGFARFIVAYRTDLAASDSQIGLDEKGESNDRNFLNTVYDKRNKDVDSQPEGFAHIRFEVEEDMPIIYIYEIQITERAQGRGLGKRIMGMIEDIATANGISTIMLTVFSRNTLARKLYESIGYSKDKSSPDPETGYIILSKAIAHDSIAKTCTGYDLVP